MLLLLATVLLQLCLQCSCRSKARFSKTMSLTNAESPGRESRTPLSWQRAELRSTGSEPNSPRAPHVGRFILCTERILACTGHMMNTSVQPRPYKICAPTLNPWCVHDDNTRRLPQGTKASSTRRQPTWSAPRRPTSYSSHARQALAGSRCAMHGPSPASPCRDLGAKEVWGQEEKRVSLHACAAASRPSLARTVNGRKTSHTSHTAQGGNHATITEIRPQIAIH